MSRYFDLLGFGFFSCRFHSIQKDVTIVRKREEVGGGLLHWLEKVFFACLNGACLQIRRRTQLRRLRLPHFDFLNDREENEMFLTDNKSQ